MRKQITLIGLRTVRFDNGERLPLLFNTETGEPLYEPLIFTLTQLRATNCAVNTLRQALRSVKVLLIVLDELQVDLSERLLSGKVLDLTEVEAVVRAASLPIKDLVDDELPTTCPAKKVVRLEAVRSSGSTSLAQEVAPETKAIRLHYIRQYLSWVTTAALLRADPNSTNHQGLQVARDLIHAVLSERIPRGPTRNVERGKEGLSHEQRSIMLQAIQIDAINNPWKGADIKIRNNLLVRWYMATGVRRGELLNVRVTDINFQRCDVVIVRRADSADDPRAEQPLVKTNDRSFPIEAELMKDTHDYVLKARRAIAGAKRHPYLFVASDTGRPMSMAAVNLVFEQLRKVPGLPADLSPHVLRHTWNNSFSELADQEKFSNATENKIRSRVMGWSETSGTAAKYTKRHIRQKSREAMLALQKKLTKSDSDEA